MHRVFLYSKRAEITKTLYALCQSSLTDCYAARVHQNLASTDTTYETVHNAIRTFEKKEWIERSCDRGRAKPIDLTEAGERMFRALWRFMNILEGGQAPSGTGLTGE